MNLANWEKMDPHLLFGLINTELRNHADSLLDLCKTHNLEIQALIKKLEEAGYQYEEEQKQFR